MSIARTWPGSLTPVVARAMPADRAGLRRAIAEEPEATLPRLAFADYCDDAGEVEYAEFIRLQLEQAFLPEPRMGEGLELGRSYTRSEYMKFCLECRAERNCGPCRYHHLQHRCEDLANRGDNFWRWALEGFGAEPKTIMDVSFHRGFVERVLVADLTDWVKYDYVLARSQPVIAVEYSQQQAPSMSLAGELVSATYYRLRRRSDRCKGADICMDVFDCMLGFYAVERNAGRRVSRSKMWIAEVPPGDNIGPAVADAAARAKRSLSDAAVHVARKRCGLPTRLGHSWAGGV